MARLRYKSTEKTTMDPIKFELLLERKRNLILSRRIKQQKELIKFQKHHLKKIYNGKIWRIMQIYFYVRDHSIRMFHDPLLLARKLKRDCLTYTSHFLFNSSLKRYLPLNKTTIIALPTVDWNTPLFQRPQHLALQFAKRINFIFCTYNYKYDHIYGIKKIKPRLIVTNLWKDAVRFRPHSWIWLLSTQQLITIQQIKDIKKNGGRIIYDYVDEIHEDISGSSALTQFLVERHEYMKSSQTADLVLCVSNKLYNEMVQFYPKENVLLCPNGVDYHHFNNLKHAAIPKDIEAIVKSKNPIIGYYGALANWIDYDLLNKTAALHPKWQFVIIGIDYNGGLKKLSKIKNIHFLGAKTYEELPRYGVLFDIAIIPFARGDVAKSTSPLKLYEYMAMGKPIVVTEDLIECHCYDGVFVSTNDVKSFSEKINLALMQKNKPQVIEQIKQQALDNTWEKRALIIERFIMDKKFHK